MDFQRKPVFDAVRVMLGRSFTQAEVEAFDRAIDEGLGIAPPIQSGRDTSSAGIGLMQKWEGCAKKRSDGNFEAYPDPGSSNGVPWTIGFGSTGPDIKKGVVWTQAQCGERFTSDLARYEDAVEKAIGTAPTTQHQFDALVSFHYNTGAIGTATLTKKHIAGDYAGAKAEFCKWVYNDGVKMQGLVNRRAEEAALYAS